MQPELTVGVKAGKMLAGRTKVMFFHPIRQGITGVDLNALASHKNGIPPLSRFVHSRVFYYKAKILNQFVATPQTDAIMQPSKGVLVTKEFITYQQEIASYLTMMRGVKFCPPPSPTPDPCYGRTPKFPKPDSSVYLPRD